MTTPFLDLSAPADLIARDAGLRTGQRRAHIFHITHPRGGKPIVISDAAVDPICSVAGGSIMATAR